MDGIRKNTAAKVALVTGATGFIGSHLVQKLLKNGWQVHIVKRETSKRILSSEFAAITQHVHDGTTEGMIGCVEKSRPDVVFHLASIALTEHNAQDVEPMFRSNVLFASQLLDAMRINGVTRIVNTGTFWQHYNNEEYNPVCLYAATKHAFESILEFYVQNCDIKAITLKLSDTYGPRDRRNKLVNCLSKVAISGKSLDMSLGEQVIDLVYIDDVVDAFAIAAHNLLKSNVHLHESYAVSSGHPIHLRDLVRIYSGILGKPLEINWGARKYRNREMMEPWKHSGWLTDWLPKTNLEEGLGIIVDELRLSGYHFDGK